MAKSSIIGSPAASSGLMSWRMWQTRAAISPALIPTTLQIGPPRTARRSCGRNFPSSSLASLAFAGLPAVMATTIMVHPGRRCPSSIRMAGSARPLLSTRLRKPGISSSNWSPQMHSVQRSRSSLRHPFWLAASPWGRALLFQLNLEATSMGFYISPPVPIAASLMDGIVRKLKDANFDEKHCGARLGFYNQGLPDFSGSQLARPFLGSASDALDVLLALFLLNEEVPADQVMEVFTEADLYALQAMSLIAHREDAIYSPVCLFPCSGDYLVTDRRAFPRDNPPEFSRIMWLYQESYVLAGLVDRTTHMRRALDLGTGSGIHALKAAHHSDEVIGVDINPRAIALD